MTTIDEALETTSKVLLVAARTLWRSVLHGCNTPSRVMLSKRMSEPVPGDWVYESSTSYGSGKFPALERLGVLARTTWEPVQMEWNVETDGPHPTEEVFYLDLLDGRQYRWTNANMIAFAVATPDGPKDFESRGV